MNIVNLLLATTVGSILGAPLPACAGVLIMVDKAAQRMHVAVDGRPLHSWPVSTGRASYETPAGTFRPFRLAKEHFSKEWDDAPMPLSIFFTAGGHAIHGSYDTRRLGRRASHGCIRLAPAKAAALFALVQAEGVGATKIVVTEGNPARTVEKAARPRRTGSGLNQFQAAARPVWMERRRQAPRDAWDEVWSFSE